MFQVVEFDQTSGGGLGIVRDDWLTPRKKETFWPPYKISSQFNKALTEGQVPESTWPIYKIERIFYTTDDILKAREKERLAVVDSDVQTDGTIKKKRKRIPKKPFSCNGSSDDDVDLNSNIIANNCKNKPIARKRLIIDDSSEDDSVINHQLANKEELSNLRAQNLFDALPSDDFGNLSCNVSQDVHAPRTFTSSPVSTPLGADLPSTSCGANIFIASSPLALDPPSTPHTHNSQCSKSLDVIAKHLASIEKRLSDLYSNQQLLMKHFLPTSGPYPTPGTAISINVSGDPLIPSDITLPCRNHEDLEKLEVWLEKEDNQKTLEKRLYLRGGKKINAAVPRMLETLFTNEIASNYNWTGKNNKRQLKDLKINKIIQSAVRRNHLTATATDFDINSIVRNWFRYTKDRDGGREQRRKENRRPTATAFEGQE